MQRRGSSLLIRRSIQIYCSDDVAFTLTLIRAGPRPAAESAHNKSSGRVVKVCSISQVCGIGGAQLMSQSSRAAGRPSLPRQMRVTQCLSEVRLRVCALQKSERGIVIFFRSFIARNLKVTLQISFRCFLGTTVSFRIESVKLIRFHAHCRFDMSFFDIFRCDIFRCLVSVIHIYGTHRKIR